MTEDTFDDLLSGIPGFSLSWVLSPGLMLRDCVCVKGRPSPLSLFFTAADPHTGCEFKCGIIFPLGFVCYWPSHCIVAKSHFLFSSQIRNRTLRLTVFLVSNWLNPLNASFTFRLNKQRACAAKVSVCDGNFRQPTSAAPRGGLFGNENGGSGESFGTRP